MNPLKARLTQQLRRDEGEVSNRAAGMGGALHANVRGVGLLGCSEVSDMQALAIDVDRGPVPAAWRWARAEDSAAAVRMGRLQVLRILDGRHIAQVAKPVVVSNAVDVVDAFWQVAVNVEPRKAVSQVGLPINRDLDVPEATLASSDVACSHAGRASVSPAHAINAPCKDASLLLVVK